MQNTWYNISDEKEVISMYLTLKQQVKHLSKNELKTSRTTLRQKRIARKRNNRIEDYLSKAARMIIKK